MHIEVEVQELLLSDIDINFNMKRILVCLLVLFSVSASGQRYFAELRSDTVYRVIVIETAEKANQLLGGVWAETFYNTPGKNFAGIGFRYYQDKQNFSPPRPYPSWVLDDGCNWQPPIQYPEDGKNYIWNEETKQWVEIET